MRTVLPLALLSFIIFGCHSKLAKMNHQEYSETAKFLWQTYVPQSGQAETIQGELIRAIEKLAYEAQGNGNINFNSNCHGLLIDYLRKHLTADQSFDEQTIAQINKDLDILSIEDEPYTDDDVYDRVTHRIVDWYLRNKTPIPNANNPKLNC